MPIDLIRRLARESVQAVFFARTWALDVPGLSCLYGETGLTITYMDIGYCELSET